MPMQKDADQKFPECRAIFGVAGMVNDFHKPAGERCPHQRLHGCAIYDKRPLGCRIWSCRWLTNEDTADQRRPDRSHVVIDTVPDFIRVDLDGERQTVPVVQYWCDPRFPDAHRAPAIRTFMRRRAAEGLAALVRFSERTALIIFAPELTGRDDWYETDGANVLPPGVQITATGEAVPRP